MIVIDVDAVFGDDWTDSLEPKLSRAMMNAILNAFSDGYIFEGTPPDESQMEAIEAGIAELTAKLVE